VCVIISPKCPLAQRVSCRCTRGCSELTLWLPRGTFRRFDLMNKCIHLRINRRTTFLPLVVILTFLGPRPSAGRSDPSRVGVCVLSHTHTHTHTHHIHTLTHAHTPHTHTHTQEEEEEEEDLRVIHPRLPPVARVPVCACLRVCVCVVTSSLTHIPYITFICAHM